MSSTYRTTWRIETDYSKKTWTRRHDLHGQLSKCWTKVLQRTASRRTLERRNYIQAEDNSNRSATQKHKYYISRTTDIQCYTKNKSNNEESAYGWRTTSTSTKQGENYTRKEVSYTTQSTTVKHYINTNGGFEWWARLLGEKRNQVDQTSPTTKTNTLHTHWWARTSANIYTWTIQDNTRHQHTDRWSITDQRWMEYNRHACRTTIHVERYNHLHTQRWVWNYTWGCSSTTTTRASRHTTGSKKSKRQTTTYTAHKARDGRTRTYTHALQKLVSNLRQSKRQTRCLQTTAIKAASHTDWLCVPQDIYRWAKHCSTDSSWCTITAVHGTCSTRQSNPAWLHDQQPTFIHSWMWTYKWIHSMWQWTYIEDNSYRSSSKDRKHYSQTDSYLLIQLTRISWKIPSYTVWPSEVTTRTSQSKLQQSHDWQQSSINAMDDTTRSMAYQQILDTQWRPYKLPKTMGKRLQTCHLWVWRNSTLQSTSKATCQRRLSTTQSNLARSLWQQWWIICWHYRRSHQSKNNQETTAGLQVWRTTTEPATWYTMGTKASYTAWTSLCTTTTRGQTIYGGPSHLYGRRSTATTHEWVYTETRYSTPVLQAQWQRRLLETNPDHCYQHLPDLEQTKLHDTPSSSGQTQQLKLQQQPTRRKHKNLQQLDSG